MDFTLVHSFYSGDSVILFFGTQCRVVLWMPTYVSEKRTASSSPYSLLIDFLLSFQHFYSEDGGNIFLWNFSVLLGDNTPPTTAKAVLLPHPPPPWSEDSLQVSHWTLRWQMYISVQTLLCYNHTHVPYVASQWILITCVVYGRLNLTSVRYIPSAEVPPS
jgi:hypothetical protein